MEHASAGARVLPAQRARQVQCAHCCITVELVHELLSTVPFLGTDRAMNGILGLALGPPEDLTVSFVGLRPFGGGSPK